MDSSCPATVEDRRDRQTWGYRKRKKLPAFDGDGHAYRWMIQVEQHFYTEGTPEYAKLPAVVEALEGRAYVWYQFWKWHNPDATGWEVVKSVVMRFQPEYERHRRFDDRVSIIGGGRSGLSMGETEIEMESEPLLEKWGVKKVVEDVMTEKVIGELVEEDCPKLDGKVKSESETNTGLEMVMALVNGEEPPKKVDEEVDSEVTGRSPQRSRSCNPSKRTEER